MLHNIDCGDAAQHSADCSHINQRGPAALQHEHAASAVKVATKFHGTKYWETVVLPKIGTPKPLLVGWPVWAEKKQMTNEDLPHNQSVRVLMNTYV